MMKLSEAATARLVQTAQEQDQAEKVSSGNASSEDPDVWTFVDSDGMDNLEFEHGRDFGPLILSSKSNDFEPMQMGKLVLYNKQSLVPIGSATIDVHAQQLVYQFASDVLQRQEFNGTADSVDKTAQNDGEKLDSNHNAVDPTSTGRKYAQEQDQDSRTQERTDPRDHSNLPAAKGSPAGTSVDEGPHDATKTVMNMDPEILRQISELLASPVNPNAPSESATLAGSSADSLILRFKDAMWRKFTFPWDLVKTWKLSTQFSSCSMPGFTNLHREWKL